MISSIRRKNGSSLNGSRARWQRLLGLCIVATTLTACSGGGGSSSKPLAQSPARYINANNAEAALKLTFEMMDLTDVLAGTWGLGAGINETRCESGSGAGTVTACVIGANTFSGAVTATVTETKDVPIPGASGSRTLPTAMTLAITNLQWQSSKNRATYTVAGNLTLSYTYPLEGSPLAVASATGTLTLTDVSTGTRYQYRDLTQRYTLAFNEDTRDYELTHTDHKGAVVYMDEDTNYQLTSGIFREYLALVGNTSSLAATKTLLGDALSVRIDTDGDTTYDTFLTIPFSEIGKGHSGSISAPTVSISGPASPKLLDKGIMVELEAQGNDADLNFVTYSWSLIKAPPGATGDKAAIAETFKETTAKYAFTPSVAGMYTVAVTITEAGTSNPPLSSSAQIELRVGMDTPTIDVGNLKNAVGTVGVSASFPITLQNLEGAITTELLSAPAGMKLEGNQLVWNPQPQFFPGSSETVTVKVRNEDRSTIKSFPVTVSNNAALPPLVTPALAINDFTTDASIANVNGTNELLMPGSGTVFFGLTLGGANPAAVVANPYALDISASNLLGVKALRTNGAISAYAVVSNSAVFVVDATTFAVRSSRALAFNAAGAVARHRLAVADIDGDGNDEIIVLTKGANNLTSDQLFVLNQRDLSTRATIGPRALGQQFLVGNVTGDSAPEIVCGNGLIADARTLAVIAEAGAIANGRNYVLADVDGDGLQEIVEIGDAGNQIVVVNVDSGVRNTPITLDTNVSALDLFAANVDNDAQDELLVGDINNQVRVYSLNGGGSTLAPERLFGTALTGNTVREVVRGNIAGGSDNQLVLVSRNSGGGALISSAQLPLTGSGTSTTLLKDGTSQTVATGSFSGARPMDVGVDGSFVVATLLRNGIAGRGVFATNSAGEPAITSLNDAAFNSALYAASADIDGNGQQDFIASTQRRNVTSLSIMAQPEVSDWLLPVTAGLPAPIAAGQIGGSASIDAVYIEHTLNSLFDHAVALVAYEVGGSELARVILQSGGSLAADPLVAVANLDGDGNDEVVLLDGTKLRAYKLNGAKLEPTGNTPDITDGVALAVGDINGDGVNEIAVSRSNGTVELYDNTLTLIAQGTVTRPTTALSFYQNTNGGPSLWLLGSDNNVVALDARSLAPAWVSPLLHGTVNSIDAFKTSSGDQLRVGTQNAFYRTRL